MALELGPCQALFGDDGSEEDLGETQGGVSVNFSTELADLLSDQFGTAPKDQVITGQGASITVPLAEYTLNNLAFGLNQDLKDLSGVKGVKGSIITGTRLKTKAKHLLLKKYVDGVPSSDEEDWLRFPMAAATGSFEVPFSGSDQRIIEVTFTAFPDDNDVLYFLGSRNAAESGDVVT